MVRPAGIIVYINTLNKTTMKLLFFKLAIVAAVLASVITCESAIAQDVYRCAGKTAKGKPCMNIVPKQGDYCRLHGPNVIYCAGIKSNGKPCHMTVKAKGDYCRWHINQKK